MKFEDCFVIFWVLGATVFLVCIKLMACIGLAYGLLWSGNYLAEAWEQFPLAAYEIEIVHVLLAALLIAILLHAGPDIQGPVNRLDSSISFAVGGVQQKAHEITLKLNALDEILSTLELIQLDTTEIKNDIDMRD